MMTKDQYKELIHELEDKLENLHACHGCAPAEYVRAKDILEELGRIADVRSDSKQTER
jgi:hypothetical protein